jgi:hypothetical protein
MEENRMRSVIRSVGVVLVVMAFLLYFVPASFADDEASATKRVVAKVLANIGVGAATPAPVEVQAGKFNITIPYRIDANTQFVKITICASHLYKADDPSSPVAAIPVSTSDAAGVVPTNGNESGGSGDNKLAFVGDCTIGNFKGKTTETGTFESSQAGKFSQDVVVTVTWNQDDPEKPIGEYSGFVKMTAAVVP